MHESLPLKELPLSLYSLNIINESWQERPDEILEITFGSPIQVQFSGCRETMKRKDWIGIYPLDANFDAKITTATCGTKWTFLAGPISPMDDAITDARLFTRNQERHVQFGRTPVVLSKSEIPGLRVVQGTVQLFDLMIPWKMGVYEIRYHHDGKYNVAARSKPFRIILEDVQRPIKSAQGIMDQLGPLIKTCMGLGANVEFCPDESILAKVLPGTESSNFLYYLFTYHISIGCKV